jgi:sugar transferase (PEP-CTERM/EpsH1 system associated)
MKILYLAHRIPYPPNKGDKIRSFNEIKHLSRKHDVHLACLADDPGDLKYAKDLTKYCAKVRAFPLNPRTSGIRAALSPLRVNPFSAGYFYSPALQKTVSHWFSSEDYRAVICFSSPMTEYLFRIPSLRDRFHFRPAPCALRPVPCLIIDFCDLDSDKWAQYARATGFPKNLIYFLESKLLLSYEKRINRLFDHSVFVSKNEADLFLRLFPQARNISVIPNGVDFEYFSPDISHIRHPVSGIQYPVLLFTGAMDYHANIDGVLWFHKQVLPCLRRNLPNSRLFIVGSNPSTRVKALDRNNGVKVTGLVEDVRPYYEMAHVSVIPLRLARGIQNKVLEAMAMGKPVVTTNKALQGIGARHGQHLLAADDAETFSRAVVSLIEDPEKANAMGRRARRFVEEHFDWSRNMAALGSLL